MAKKKQSLKKKSPPALADVRGVSTFDYDGKSIWVQADPEAVTDALSGLRKAGVVEKNVVNRYVALTDQCFLVFRLRGHTWTQIIARDCLIVNLIMDDKHSRKEKTEKIAEALKHELNEEDARLLSESLSYRALFYGISDTACAMMYGLYEKGKLIERLETGEGYEIKKWKSAIHSQKKKEIEQINPEKWVTDLFVEMDAFDPGLSSGYLFGIGRQDSITLNDQSDTFERADFVGL